MTPFAVERHDGTRHDWLGSHADQWVAAGLITPEQAASLQAYEEAHAAPAGGRLGPLAEAAAFVGAVLALIGGAVGLGPEWGGMNTAVRLVIAAAVAMVGFVAGTWLMQLGEPATRRLGSFLWVLGTGGVALAAGTTVDAIDPVRDAWMGVAIGLPAAAIGIGLWRDTDRPLQLLTAAVGLGIGLGGVATLVGTPVWLNGLVVWAAAVAWWALTFTAEIRPLVVARCIGSAAAIAGAFMLMDLSVHLGPVLALATAAGVVLLGLRLHTTAVLVVGVLGAVMATQTLLQNTLHGPLAATGVAVAGLLTVVGIVVRARRTPTA